MNFKFMFRIVIIISIIFSIGAMIYFILGRTAMFQRRTDIVADAFIVAFLIPNLIATIFLIARLVRNTGVTSTILPVLDIVVLCAIVVISIILIVNSTHQTWTEDRIVTDRIQTTEDGLFEFQMEVIDLFQRNVEANVLITNLESGLSYRIPLEGLPMREIRATTLPGDQNPFWIIEEINESNDRIRLSTSSSFQPGRQWVFEIDIERQTSMLIESNQRSHPFGTVNQSYVYYLQIDTLLEEEFLARLEFGALIEDVRNRDLETQIIPFPIKIHPNELVFESFDFGWSGNVHRGRVVEMHPTEDEHIYIVTLTDQLLINPRRFELNIEAESLTELH